MQDCVKYLVLSPESNGVEWLLSQRLEKSDLLFENIDLAAQ